MSVPSRNSVSPAFAPSKQALEAGLRAYERVTENDAWRLVRPKILHL